MSAVPAMCPAKKKNGPGTCGHQAGWGTDHPGFGPCRYHGGNTTAHKIKAARDKAEMELRVAEQGARIQLGREGLVPISNPIKELQGLAAEVVNLKRILGDQVERLQDWDYSDRDGKREVQAVLLAYERALDRSDRILTNMARLNLDEKALALDEQNANLLFQILTAVFGSRDVGLTKAQKDAAWEVVAIEANAD